MDFGSIICTPRNPDCDNCLIQKYCNAFKYNLQDVIPVKLKSKSAKRKKYSRAYIFYNEKNEILVRKRPSKGMLASMLEVPNDNWVINKKKLVQDKIVLKLKNIIEKKDFIKRTVTHTFWIRRTCSFCFKSTTFSRGYVRYLYSPVTVGPNVLA